MTASTDEGQIPT